MMYGIPKELDLSPIINQFTTQVRVGQFDIQFTFGDVNFTIESPIDLFRNGNIFGHWEPGKWPEAGFYEIMNAEVSKYQVVNEKLIIISLNNGIEVHLVDNSEQYESMQISIKGDPRLWVI